MPALSGRPYKIVIPSKHAMEKIVRALIGRTAANVRCSPLIFSVTDISRGFEFASGSRRTAMSAFDPK
jgi:hypothetical protein